MKKISLSGDDWVCKYYLGEDWVWRNGEKRDTKDVRWWNQAVVPGCAMADMIRSNEIPDPFFERNSLFAEWIPQRTWIYRKEFCVDEQLEGNRLFLRFEGIDYDADLFLNDVHIGEHHSMFTPVEIEVTGLIARGEKNLLAVVLHHAPDEQPQVSRTRYVKTHKSRMTYWWDFCPRMIHIGIWDDVDLYITGGIRLQKPQVQTYLRENSAKADVRVWIGCQQEDQPGEVLVQLLYRDQILKETVGIKAEGGYRADFVLENPLLWWPAGYGNQPLYTMRVTAKQQGVVSDEQSVRFGIREARFLSNATEDETARPYTLCINGESIYLKGYNWVPMDAMYGLKQPEKLSRLLELIREANINCLRIWGGGLIEREEFYDWCDEHGILLWQEFIQSSSGIENEPSRCAEFLTHMEQEAAVIIPRKRNHPSLVIWGGGNELSGPDNAMISAEEPVIAVLQEQVRKLDPQRMFLESSPTGRVFNNTLENIARDPMGLHDVHGPWEHQGLKEQYTLYNAGTSLLSSEFGVEGMANYDTLARCLAPEHMWPPSRDNACYFHRGSWWNNYPLLQECFAGSLTEIHEVIRGSQLLQYEGLKYAVEANRRRMPQCSGTFPWQFNEPYPNYTCTCCVDYYTAPKPAYYGIKRAYGPCTVTAAFEAQSITGMDRIRADLFWQSEKADIYPDRVAARIMDSSGICCGEEQILCGKVKAAPQCAEKVGCLICSADRITTELFFLIIEAYYEGRILAENRYLFTKSTLKPLLELEKASVSVKSEKAGERMHLFLENTGKTTAVGLWLEDAEAADAGKKEYLFFDKNYFYLMPGESQRITVWGAKKERHHIRISAWNMTEHLLYE